MSLSPSDSFDPRGHMQGPESLQQAQERTDHKALPTAGSANLPLGSLFFSFGSGGGGEYFQTRGGISGGLWLRIPVWI